MPQRIIENIEKVIIGKHDVVKSTVTALLAGGHVLLEDIPGTGKTMLARALAVSIGGTTSRIQFTSDLLPADIVGTAVFNPDISDFQIRKGPIFANIVLGDEINRATPRTQSALLECMGENQITIEKQSFQLEEPFMVIATQNPIEYEGCYPLVESQLDRFWLKLSMGYPSMESEVSILTATMNDHPVDSLEQIITLEEIQKIRNNIKGIHVEEKIIGYIARLLDATRNRLIK